MELIALILIVLLAINPEIGLYAMAFFLPIINWNFSYYNLEIPFIDLLSLAVVTVFLFRQAYLFLFNRENFKISWPLFFSFSFFFATAVISSLFSDNVSLSLWYVVRWILFFYLIYLVLPYNLIKDKRILKNILIWFAISSVVVAVSGVISLYSQDWQNDFVRIKPLGIAGVYPTGDNQNLLAEVLIAGIFFALALKYWFQTERQKRLINLLIIFLSIILIGTFSRAAWIALAIQILIYFSYKKELFRKALLPAFLVILLLTPIYYYMFRLQSQYSIGVSSTENRLLLTQISWRAFTDKPWFGQGSGNFVSLVADNIRFRAKYGDPIDSHGVWQKILAENGLAGVLTFALFSFNIFYLFYKALKHRSNEFDLLLPLVIGSLGIYLFEFFNTSYYKGKLWLPIAVTLSAINLARNKKLYAEKN